MCGIAGIFSLDERSCPDDSILASMCEAMRHRGPDDEGFYREQFFKMGVRRLSVIDLFAGHQPIANEEETLWVICNGEIYNYRDLREYLLKKGHEFRTRSDTEVIVHLYEEKGVDCVKDLDGMFAFAIWDTNSKTLFLARDRLGEKPLYYGIFKNQFIFASELKVFLKHPDVERNLDVHSLYKYLIYEFIPAPLSIIRGIQKLPAGHVLVCQKNRRSVFSYWDLPGKMSGRIEGDEQEVQERTISLLANSIKKRLMSDVPLGVFLSGGIDSCAMVALMSQYCTKVKTFSIGFKERSFNEAPMAREIARFFGTEHRETSFTSKELIEMIPKLPSLLDEPLGDAAILPTYFLSKFARQFVTVVLEGDGGDELFAGYPTYQAHRIASRLGVLRSLLGSGFIQRVVDFLPVSHDYFSFDFKVKRFVKGLSYSPVERNYVWLGSFSPQEAFSVLSKGAQSSIDPAAGFEEVHAYAGNGVYSGDLLNKMLYIDTKLYLQDDLLTKVDRATMAASLEARAPYLDHALVEFVSGLPSDLKLRGLTTKYILRRALKGLVPEKVLTRRKKGFGVPVGRWLQEDLRGFAQEVLSREILEKQGLLNGEFVQRLLMEHLRGHKDHRKILWTLLVFQIWYRHYIEEKRL
jgi:asparagine synthase (glutamine-hydrolysing)